jgi:Ca2+-binding EF-hand superfamily protein
LYSIKPVLEATRAPKELASDNMDQLRELLNRMKRESDIKGHVVKNYFKDFDLHNHGIITRSQFLQSIPFRNLKENEILMILDRFQCNDGLDINYLQFHEEIEGKELIPTVERSNFWGYSPDDSYQEAAEVETLLRTLILKYQIKLDDTFRDYDSLRSGFITKNQFMGALGSIKLPKTVLTQRELNAVAEKYKIHDNDAESKVAYMEFLRNMNKVFNSTGLEKFPLKKFKQPNHLLKTSKQTLSTDKEDVIDNILDRVRHMIYTKRMLLKPFFQDFDKTQKGTFSTRHVTRTRFERGLAMLGITLSEREYQLLAHKYDDLNDGHVNYIMFLDDVDEGHNDDPFMNKDNQKNFNATWGITLKNKQVDYHTLIAELLFKTFKDRVRIEEFMRDFDPLRSGAITTSQFRSGLTMAGLKVTDNEFLVLREAFGDPKKDGYIKYKVFCDEVDKIFTEKGLEKAPLRETMATRQFIDTTKTMKQPQVQYDSEHMSELLAKLRHFVDTRGILLKPQFQDFDKHNRSRISKENFKQGLDKIFKFSHIDYDVLLDNYYEDETGLINYLKFLDDIDPRETHGTELILSKSKYPHYQPDDPNDDVQDVLTEIRSQVKKNRIRLRDFFTDFDKLRTGRCIPQKFRSGLSMAKLTLSAHQMNLIENYFKVDDIHDEKIDYVSYSDFCDAIDMIFTEKHLEKMPTRTINQFKPKSRFPLLETTNGLAQDVKDRYSSAMEKIYFIMTSRHILLKPYFQDYELVNKERVTKTQFAAVLDKLKVELSEAEMNAIMKKYMDNRGDVDYVSFCTDVEKQAKVIKSWNPHMA